jgi:GTP-binding protein HflX
VPQILVLNKADRLPDPESDAASLRAHAANLRSVSVSALTGAGIDELLAAIDDLLPVDPVVRTTLRLSSGDGATLAMLHEFGRVLDTRYLEDGAVVEVEVEIPESVRRRLTPEPRS